MSFGEELQHVLGCIGCRFFRWSRCIPMRVARYLLLKIRRCEKAEFATVVCSKAVLIGPAYQTAWPPKLRLCCMHLPCDGSPSGLLSNPVFRVSPNPDSVGPHKLPDWLQHVLGHLFMTQDMVFLHHQVTDLPEAPNRCTVVVQIPVL